MTIEGPVSWDDFLDQELATEPEPEVRRVERDPSGDKFLHRRMQAIARPVVKRVHHGDPPAELVKVANGWILSEYVLSHRPAASQQI